MYELVSLSTPGRLTRKNAVEAGLDKDGRSRMPQVSLSPTAVATSSCAPIARCSAGAIAPISPEDSGWGWPFAGQGQYERRKTTNARRDGSPTRTQDPEGTRRNILEIASEEFAANGLSGARIDEIAARTRSSKRMIYYYFGDKEGLYLSAL